MLLTSTSRPFLLTGVAYACALAWACSAPKPVHESSTTAPVVTGDLSTPFGPMKPVVSVKELMANMIDPVADNIFDAVWWDSTAKGVVEHKPTTDEDWDKVKTGAITLAEGIELLKMPRLFAPAGDVNNSLGPNPPELSPVQFKAKIDKDPVLWIAKIQALRNVSLEVLDVVKKRDAKALWDAGADLDNACEACHLEYWYPGDLKAVLADKNGRARFEKPR